MPLRATTSGTRLTSRRPICCRDLVRVRVEVRVRVGFRARISARVRVWVRNGARIRVNNLLPRPAAGGERGVLELRRGVELD